MKCDVWTYLAKARRAGVACKPVFEYGIPGLSSGEKGYVEAVREIGQPFNVINMVMCDEDGSYVFICLPVSSSPRTILRLPSPASTKTAPW